MFLHLQKLKTSLFLFISGAVPVVLSLTSESIKSSISSLFSAVIDFAVVLLSSLTATIGGLCSKMHLSTITTVMLDSCLSKNTDAPLVQPAPGPVIPQAMSPPSAVASGKITNQARETRQTPQALPLVMESTRKHMPSVDGAQEPWRRVELSAPVLSQTASALTTRDLSTITSQNQHENVWSGGRRMSLPFEELTAGQNKGERQRPVQDPCKENYMGNDRASESPIHSITQVAGTTETQRSVPPSVGGMTCEASKANVAGSTEQASRHRVITPRHDHIAVWTVSNPRSPPIISQRSPSRTVNHNFPPLLLPLPESVISELAATNPAGPTPGIPTELSRTSKSLMNNVLLLLKREPLTKAPPTTIETRLRPHTMPEVQAEVSDIAKHGIVGNPISEPVTGAMATPSSSPIEHLDPVYPLIANKHSHSLHVPAKSNGRKLYPCHASVITHERSIRIDVNPILVCFLGILMLTGVFWIYRFSRNTQRRRPGQSLQRDCDVEKGTAVARDRTRPGNATRTG